MKLTRLLPYAALMLLPAAARAQAPTPAVYPASKPTLEMVFVLDTTGSMGGMIDAAKQKIWSIVNDVLKSPSHPHIRVGLVAYRDHGDVYVTKVLPITSDLDQVYSTLMTYKADGGGDTPEDVRQALADGVHKPGWSPRLPHLAQILFLVGDAPPHDDYTNEPDTLTTTAEAIGKGIIVNAIECGNAEDTRVSWEAIARRGEGQYFDIAENGGVQTIPTPYDESLAKIGGKMGTTYMAYGGGEFRHAAAALSTKVESSVTYASPTPVAADRAVNKALNTEAYDSDLLQSIQNGTTSLAKIPTKDLPDDLQKLTPTERQKEVARRLAQRKALQAQILALSKKRDAYLLEAGKKQAARGKSAGLDAAVDAALKKQLAPKGILLQ